MNNEQNPVYTEEFEELLPDGWTGADSADIFDPATWGSAADADAQTAEQTSDAGESFGESAEEDLATALEAGNQAGETDENSPATAEETPVSEKLKFRVTIDHNDQDVELDPSELPSLYEKASALDRYKQRMAALEQERNSLNERLSGLEGVDEELAEWDAIAAGLKYDDRNALRKSVIENAVQNYIEEHPGVPEDMARDYITRRFAPQKPVKKEAPAPQQAPSRDFKQEVADLFAAHPEARGTQLDQSIIDEVINNGKPLVQAYAEWAAKKAEAEARTAKSENKILKQNQAAAARAPVTKVTGGGRTDTSPEDDFLRGFNADSEW